ncbi:MAG: DUF4190 domain-containing protein [Phycisphaerales bacterium]
MTHSDSNSNSQRTLQNGGDASVPATAPALSAFAVTSFISSSIICCPATALLGIVLGIAALVSIAAHPHARRGKGFAIAGIAIGIAVTIGWGVAMYIRIDLQKKIDISLRTHPEEAMAAAFAGDPAAFRHRAVGPLARMSDEEITNVVAQLRKRYGEFRRLTFDEAEMLRNPPDIASLTSGELVYPFEFSFDGRTLPGRLVLTQRSDQGSNVWSEIRIRSYEIIDADLGNIMLPPP